MFLQFGQFEALGLYIGPVGHGALVDHRVVPLREVLFFISRNFVFRGEWQAKPNPLFENGDFLVFKLFSIGWHLVMLVLV